jgi:hypothetical protein
MIAVTIENGDQESTKRTGDDYVDTLFRAMRDSMTLTTEAYLIGLVAEAIVEGELSPELAGKLVVVLKTVAIPAACRDMVNCAIGSDEE